MNLQNLLNAIKLMVFLSASALVVFIVTNTLNQAEMLNKMMTVENMACLSSTYKQSL